MQKILLPVEMFVGPWKAFNATGMLICCYEKLKFALENGKKK